MSPRTPSSPDEPASFHPRTAHERSLTFLRVRAPFRLLPTRAPRQTWLRASSWLAPSRVVEPCDPTAWKARDASRRPLPPNRTACTRTSRVPGSVRQFPAGDPHGVLGSVRLFTGGPRGSRPSSPLRRTVLDTAPVLYCLAAWSHERGRFLPTAPMIDRASDVPVAEPCSLSASPTFAGAACFTERPPRGGVARVGECTLGQDRRSHVLVKDRASFRSRTPSIGRDPS